MIIDVSFARQLWSLTSLSNLLIAAVVYEIVWILYCRTLHPLAKFPGPFLASISRTWIMRTSLQGAMEHVQRDLHAKHGPMVRLAPNELSCSDPEAIKIIYGIKSGFTKTDFYRPWRADALGVDHFSNTDVRSHAKRRRTVNNVYSLSNILQSERYIDTCSELFVQRMGEYADAGEIVDLGGWLQM